MGKKILLISGGFLAFLLLLAGLFYYSNFISSNIDTEGKETYIFIPKDADADKVIALLEDQKILGSSTTLKWMMKLKKFSGKNIVPGKYKIEDGFTNNELVNHLRAGNGRMDSKIVFNQLRTLNSIAAELSKEILLDSTEILKWLNNKDSIARFGFNPQTIYCMFIPNTYFVDVDITLPKLMNKMYKEYQKFWNDKRTAKAKEIGLTPAQVSTLASIVYWETKMESDIPIVAGVYMNRLKVGMPLQADPTLIFALGDFTIKRVLSGDKEIDSPYNTYKYTGLPPGPILIPPANFIDGVLNYAKHDYFYFVAKEDLSGHSYFAKTYEEHKVYAKRYQEALNKMNVHR